MRVPLIPIPSHRGDIRSFLVRNVMVEAWTGGCRSVNRASLLIATSGPARC